MSGTWASTSEYAGTSRSLSMPNTCRTDTFMSGKPAGSCALVMAAVVINPPRSRALPKPDLRWLQIGAGLGFWKAALRITPHFRRDNLPPAQPALDGTFHPHRELC